VSQFGGRTPRHNSTVGAQSLVTSFKRPHMEVESASEADVEPSSEQEYES
jgi:hypothetical protein